MLIRYEDIVFGKSGRCSARNLHSIGVCYIIDEYGFSKNGQLRYCNRTPLTPAESIQYFTDLLMYQDYVIFIDANYPTEICNRINKLIEKYWPTGFIINLSDEYIVDVMEQCKLSVEEFVKVMPHDIALGVFNIDNKLIIGLI